MHYDVDVVFRNCDEFFGEVASVSSFSVMEG